jgi:CheY-like chemotaxis protein
MDRTFQIAVADDDIDDQELVDKAFKDAKVKVVITKVFNGIELMDYLLKRLKYKRNTDPNPDLILLDLNMPLMDGFEALKEIKRIPRLSDVPIYVITTSRSEREKQQALELGANGFYHKGASSSEIKGIIKEVCLDCFSV